MRELRAVLEAWQKRRGDSFVLGTVVDVAGSSYRKPGARTLIHRDGTRVGLVSGGCLERDVVRRAFEWTSDGPRTVLFDTRSDELHPEGPYGTGCEGIVKLFLERVEPGDEAPMALLRETLLSRERRLLATVFAAEKDDSSVGARMTDGDDVAAGDRLPAPLAEKLRAVLGEASQWSRPKTVTLSGDGDQYRVLVEPLEPPIDLVVFGAGDDARPVVELAGEMGWRVRVADPRPSLATPERFPAADEVSSDPADVLAEQIEVDSGSYVLVMTHDFEVDATLVPAMLATSAPFVGLLGPRSRTRRLLKQLRSEGRLPDAEELDRLQTPLGLDLGGEAPSEVALSIVSAVLAADRGGSGRPLQEREGRIHEPHERLVRAEEST